MSKTKALEEFPMLKEEKLTGAIVYYDGEGEGGGRGGREEGRRGRERIQRENGRTGCLGVGC